MKELTEQEALHKIAVYCSGAEHCLSEVQAKLKGWMIEPDAQKRIINRLVNEKYLDEDRFCRNFIHDKFKFNKWGRIKIKQALVQKNIDIARIDKFLNDQIAEQDYAEVLQTLLHAKKKSIKASGEYELNGKLIRFALGRGFETDVILRYIKVDKDEMDF